MFWPCNSRWRNKPGAWVDFLLWSVWSLLSIYLAFVSQNVCIPLLPHPDSSVAKDPSMHSSYLPVDKVVIFGGAECSKSIMGRKGGIKQSMFFLFFFSLIFVFFFSLLAKLVCIKIDDMEVRQRNSLKPLMMQPMAAGQFGAPTPECTEVLRPSWLSW